MALHIKLKLLQVTQISLKNYVFSVNFKITSFLCTILTPKHMNEAKSEEQLPNLENVTILNARECTSSVSKGSC